MRVGLAGALHGPPPGPGLLREAPDDVLMRTSTQTVARAFQPASSHFPAFPCRSTQKAAASGRAARAKLSEMPHDALRHLAACNF
jgi:hypothetical protein